MNPVMATLLQGVVFLVMVAGISIVAIFVAKLSWNLSGWIYEGLARLIRRGP